MQKLGYYNGTCGPLDEMTVPMNDRASWFGDGVYDAGLSRNYHIFALGEHIDRLFRNAAALRIEMPLSKQELADLLNDLVKKMDTGNLLVYYQVTRGPAQRRHAFPAGKGNLWVTLTPCEMNDGTTPLRLITREDTRFFHCDIKTLNLIPSVMAAQEAEEKGCQETVFYRPGGRVTECAHSNVHILKGGTLYTAPADNLILPGIARAHLLRACQALGIPAREEPYTLEDLRNADEILVTSSGGVCLRAEELDGQPAGMKDEKTFETLRKYLMEEYISGTIGTVPIVPNAQCTMKVTGTPKP